MKTKTTAEKVKEQLTTLDWKIEDAKVALLNAAKVLQKRADEAVLESVNALNGVPCSLGWTSFMEGNLRTAKEAHAELFKLTEQHRLLSFLVREEQ